MRTHARSGAGGGARLAGVFGIDLRALAVLRIGIGLVLLLDLAARARLFRASYTDAGAVPRALLDPWMKETIAPFHLWTGGFAGAALLHGLALLFALMLLLGLRTRVAALASWLLLLSIQVRNPFLINFGDHILRVCFFWALFLPLGAVWSLDARRAAPRAPGAGVVCSVASAALLLQVCFIYFFTAILKSGPDWHGDGTALYFALQYDSIVRPLGLWLREQLLLTRLLTWGTLLLEYLGPFAMLAPVAWLRVAATLGFVGLHLGIAACLNLGIFPMIDIVVLLPFLPSPVWDALERLLRRLPGPWRAARAESGGAAAESAREAPGARGAAAPGLPALRYARAALVGALLAYVFAFNLGTVWSGVVLPAPLVRAGRILGLNQEWRMFTPSPGREDGWFVLPARLADGSLVDLSPQGPLLRWGKPERGWAATPSVRWGFYLYNLSFTTSNGAARRSHVRWLCREWNRAHPPEQQAERVDVFFMHEQTASPGEKRRLQPRYLASHECPKPGERPAPGWDVAVPESGAPPAPLVGSPSRPAAPRERG